MRKVIKSMWLTVFGLFFMVVSLASCSDDDMPTPATPTLMELIIYVLGIGDGGQSNMQNMKNQGIEACPGEWCPGTSSCPGEPKATGFSECERIVFERTGQPVETLHSQTGKTGSVGGSTPDGNTTTQGDAKAWYYPDTDEVGGAFVRAEALYRADIERLLAANPGKRVLYLILWGQGENDTRNIANASDKGEAMLRYRNAIDSVFQKMERVLSDLDVEIHWMIQKTNFVDTIGAVASGESAASANRLYNAAPYTRQAQDELIEMYDNVHFGADPAAIVGFPSARECEPIEEKEDKWHYGLEGYEALGIELGNSISNLVTSLKIKFE